MQLTVYETVTPENVKFTDPKEFKVKDSNCNIKYKRIPIEISYGNNKKGPLVIETPTLFSFGVSEKKNQETKKLVGYSVPVCLWGKDSQPNELEQAFFDVTVINNITSITNNFLEKEYGPDVASSLTSPFYYKQVEVVDKKGKKKTKKDISASPVLYAKVIYSEKSKKILSLFKTKGGGGGGEDVNPLKYINQYCNVKMALVIEGVFISKTVTALQIKVYECYIKQLKPRESLLQIDDSSDEDSEASEEDESNDEELIKKLVIYDVEEEN